MRVCFVCNEYPPGPIGGIGASTQVLSRALVEAGHEVRVVGVYPKSYPGPDYMEDRGVRVWRLRAFSFRFGWLWDRYCLFRTVANWARQGNVDVVDVPDWEGWAAGWPRLPIPVIARLCGSQTYFGAEISQTVKKTMYWLERASLRRADFWCSKSVYTAEKTRPLFGLRTGPHAILYNPVFIPANVSFGEPLNNHVVFTGTLTAKKGVISLIKAWPTVRGLFPNSELHVYGKDGRSPCGQSMRFYLEQQLHEQGAGNVYFHGHVGREVLVKALHKARVAVFPSYAESFGNAPLEAMACGCPTIFSRRCSGPELIEHGKNGLLVDPDKPEEIAEAIITVLQDERLAGRLAHAGRERVREAFSAQNVMLENVTFYQRCVRDFGGKKLTRLSWEGYRTASFPTWPKRCQASPFDTSKLPPPDTTHDA